MIRTLIDDPVVQGLALESAAALASRPEGILEPTGSAILASGTDVPPLFEAADRSRAAGRDVVASDRAPPALSRWLEGAGFEVCLVTADDGVADVDALLQAYLREAIDGGARLRTGTEVLGLARERGRVTGVVTAEGPLPASVVVNAAGAWAGQVGAPGAAGAIGIVPRKRHLHSTGPVPGVDPRQPFVWNETAGYYFRPESGGLLLSGCDQTPEPPGEPVVDPAEEERLAEKLVAHAPALAELPVARKWACHRTFAADDRFVVGWDPALGGLYWVAALGGNGVTVSDGVGRLAAREILAGASESPFDPSRFSR
jgi:D-arginine dehydrogenase